MVVDILVPKYRHPAINNHHSDSKLIQGITVTYCAPNILRSFNKKFCRKVGRSATRWFHCYWRVRLLTMITLYVMARPPAGRQICLGRRCEGRSHKLLIQAVAPAYIYRQVRIQQKKSLQMKPSRSASKTAIGALNKPLLIKRSGT